MKEIRKIKLKITLSNFWVFIPYFSYNTNIPIFRFKWLVTIHILFVRFELFKEK